MEQKMEFDTLDCKETKTMETKTMETTNTLDDSLDNNQEITLEFKTTSEGPTLETRTINKRLLGVSGLVIRILEDDKNCTNFPIINHGTSVFDAIVPFLQHRDGNVPKEYQVKDHEYNPLTSSDFAENCQDNVVFNLIETLFTNDLALFYKVMKFADYMQIDELLILMCKKMACEIKKTPSEKLVDHFNPEKVSSTSSTTTTSTTSTTKKQ